MAEPRTRSTSEEVAGAKPDKPGEDDISFTVERLLDEANVIFHEDRHVVAGAFAGVSPSTEVGLTDAKQRVKDWLKAPVVTHETPQE